MHRGCAARSVRIVAADLPSYATRAGVLPSVPDVKNLADAILEHTDWSAPGLMPGQRSATPPAPLPAHVRCKRHTTAVWAPAGISPPLRRALALRLPEALTPEPRRERAAVEIQVTLHEDGVLVELLALKQRMDRDLPCPGFRRLECYVVAQAARIKPGDVVLDPFCGKATFLAEAELCWPGASVIGVDSDPAQLDAAAKNLGSNATLLHGSATALPLADDSVDAVVSCVEIKILRRVRAESSRRPPRHRRDACSMAWRCRFLAARPSQHGRVIAEK